MRPCVGVLLCLLTACQTVLPVLPPEFAATAAEAPGETPVRLVLAGDRVVGAAVPIRPIGLPAEVHAAIEAVAPGGETLFLAREWGRRGAGYRIEKDCGSATRPDFRSALITPDGTVLERSHSVPIGEVPKDVLLAAMTSVWRDVERAEVVWGREREEGWRIALRDKAGRQQLFECAMDGTLGHASRLLQAQLATASTAR